MLPVAGAVAGVDVGYSETRKSSAICVLTWTEESIDWTIIRFRYQTNECVDAYANAIANQTILTAAFDGPLRRNFDTIRRYRCAEWCLTRQPIRSRVGKPGQSSSGNGIRLNQAANFYANMMLQVGEIGAADHAVRINDRAIVEAFPTSFMGLMIDRPESLPRRKHQARSDVYFECLAHSGGFDAMLASLLGKRRLLKNLADITNHDDRAAIICAFTALSVAAGSYSAVGDEDGWIILPGLNFMADWARSDLKSLGDKFHAA